MNEVCHGLASVFVSLGGLLAQVMHATMDVAILVQIIVALTLDDVQRFLRSGGIVEIDQGLAVDLLVEAGELGSYLVNIQVVTFVET